MHDNTDPSSLHAWTRHRRAVTEPTGDARQPFKVRLRGRDKVAGFGATEAEAARNARLSWELARLARQR